MELSTFILKLEQNPLGLKFTYKLLLSGDIAFSGYLKSNDDFMISFKTDSHITMAFGMKHGEHCPFQLGCEITQLLRHILEEGNREPTK